MLNNILGLTIVTSGDLSESDSLELIEQLECADLAKQNFINGLLSFEDFLDILKLCDVNIDDYLIIVEGNLAKAKVTL